MSNQEKTFEFQQPGYELSSLDQVINERYDIRTIDLEDDYDGPVVATLLSRKGADTLKKAMLYIHGYGDYFFHEHLGAWAQDQGFRFYALDLRKYGRSLLPHQKPSYTKDLQEYNPEISEALRIIKEEDQIEYLVLHGHSTGGLISTIYTNEGPEKDKIDALVLNSPFFEFNAGFWGKAGINAFATWSRMKSTTEVPTEFEGIYGKSLHKNYEGEWDYNLVWKPIKGFPLYGAWLRAVKKGHKKVQKGMDLQIPILVLCSTASYTGTEINEDLKTKDAVLNVEHIQEHAQKLGPNVNIKVIDGAIHDIFLSRTVARENAFKALETWLQAL